MTKYWFSLITSHFGSGHAEVFSKKGVLKNFTKFTEKHQACNFIKKRNSGASVFL